MNVNKLKKSESVDLHGYRRCVRDLNLYLHVPGTLCVARKDRCEALFFPAVTFEFQYVLIMLSFPSISIKIWSCFIICVIQ